MTNSADLKRAKRAVRRRVLASRDAMPASEREGASARIVDLVMSLPEVERASVVLVFWSFGSEPDTAALIEALHARHVRVALPRLVDGEMEPHAFAPGDAVSETSFGAREPSAGEPLDPSAIDVVVTPAVAFDRMGHRVGYGGGYYDRFFPRTRPDTFRVGIGFDVQVIDDALPSGHFDRELDAVVTESGVMHFGRTT